MQKKKVIVAGYSRLTQTAHQIQELLKLGAEVINIDPYGTDGVYKALSWQGDKITWHGHDISPEQISAVLVCAQAPDYPQQQVFDKSDGQSLSWAEWFQHFGLQRDRSDALLSTLLTLEQAGIPMFNPVSKSLLSRRKPYQISVLQNLQCPMPKTLVSNDPLVAADFIRATGDCIIKPVAGGSLTLSANKLLAAGQLSNLQQAPAIIQQRIYGDDLRVVVIAGKVVSAVAVGVPADSIDFRGEQQYQSGQVSYREVVLPDTIRRKCVQAVAALGLHSSGIDLKHTKDDQYYFLECNSAPIYLDVENKMGHAITATLSKALLGA